MKHETLRNILRVLLSGLGAGIIVLLLLIAYFSRGVAPLESDVRIFWIEELSNILFYWILAVVMFGIIAVIVRAEPELVKGGVENSNKTSPREPMSIGSWSKNNIFIYFLFLLLGIFSIYKLLFLPGVIGFRHDWSVPIFSLDGFYFNWRYIWRETDLGANIFNQGYLTTWLHDFYLWILSLLGISGGLYSKLSIILAITFSGISSYHLCYYLQNRNKKNLQPITYNLQALIPALFYSLTPILFDKIVAGQTTYIFAYSIAPWALLYYFKSDQRKFNLKNAAIIGIILALASVQIHFLLMISFLFIVYLIFAESKINLIKTIIFSWIITALIHAPIIIPFILNLSSRVNNFSANLAVSEWISSLSNPISAIIVLSSAVNPYFRLALGENIFWTSASLFVPVMVFSALLWKPLDKKVVFALAILLAALFLSAGNVNLQNFPLVSIFRELYHLFWIIAISYVILLTHSVSYINIKLKNHPWLLVTGYWLLVLLILFYSYPFFTGDFGGQLQVYNPNPAYQRLQEKFKNDEGDYRVLWLPSNQKNRPINLEFGGTDALIKGSPKPPISQEGNILSAGDPRSRLRNQIISKLYYGDSENNLSQLLAIANIRYIVHRDDFIDQFPDYTLLKNYPELASQWNNQNLKTNLKKIPNVNLVEKDGPISLYENTSQLPKLYLTDLEVDNKSKYEIIEPGVCADTYYNAQKGWIRGWYWWWRNQKFASTLDSFIYTEKEGAKIEIPINNTKSGDYELWIKGYSLDKENEIELRVTDYGLRITNISTNDWEWKKAGEVNLPIATRYSLLATNAKGRNGLAQIALIPKGKIFNPIKNQFLSINNYEPVDYEKINPSYYKVKFKVNKPSYLVFSEGYDDEWVIKNMEDIKNIIMAGYANGFYIDKDGEYEIDLIYKNQKWYDLGLIVSLGTFIFLLIILNNHRSKI